MPDPSPPHTPAPERSHEAARLFLAVLLLVAAVCVAYARVWHAGFIWDDDDHLTNNPCIIGPLGFSAIWTSSKAVYYPLVLTTFWVEHLIWGLNPLPYHVVNVLVHAADAVLLWLTLRRLKVQGAWLGAALWALHPVQVESAAWITELKNTQSCFFYLLAIIFFLKWLALAEAPDAGHVEGFPRARAYGMALLCATLAILSKSSTVMLPVVLGLCWWWMDGRWRMRNIPWLVPFFMVSAGASLWTIWEQKYANHALGAEWSQSTAQRAIVAGKDVWFYLWKLAWPHPLTFIYPVWTTDASRVTEFFPLAAVIVALLLLWLGRKGAWRPVFFAMAYFAISLFPVLSFFNVYFFRYSFVGDHFQYLASIGPLALAGAGIAAGAKWLRLDKGPVYPAVAGALLVVLAMLTWLQCGVYFNLETLWRRTLADNPNAWIAHFNLGNILMREGRLDDAVAEFREHLRLKPDSEDGIGNLANVLAIQGHTDEAIGEYQTLLQVDPDSVLGNGDYALVLLRRGKVDEAITHAQKAVELARHTDENGEGHNDAAMLRILAVTYARAGRYPEAIESAKMALQRAESQSNMTLAAALTQEIAGYEAAAGKTP
jgi:tetratricopeptide (TPR) repeat protein